MNLRLKTQPNNRKKKEIADKFNLQRKKHNKKYNKNNYKNKNCKKKKKKKQKKKKEKVI